MNFKHTLRMLESEELSVLFTVIVNIRKVDRPSERIEGKSLHRHIQTV